MYSFHFQFVIIRLQVYGSQVLKQEAWIRFQQQQLRQEASSITLQLASVRIAKCRACNSSQQLLLRSRIVFQIKFVVRGTGFLVGLPLSH